jgi:hypothetical protein
MSKKPKSIFQQYRTDPILEEEGVWVEGLRDGLDVLIARLGNSLYKTAYGRLSKPFRAQIERGTLGEEKGKELLIQALAEAVFLSFRGPAAIDDDGNPLEDTKAVRIALLTDLPDFREDVLFVSKEAETFKRQETEDAVGNSHEPSSGTSGGPGSPTPSEKG